MNEYFDYLEKLLPIGRKAAVTLMKYHLKDVAVQHKSDASPVTEADHASNAILLEGMAEAFPDISIISEEDDELADPSKRFWLVDPLDGTRSFLRGEEEFVISIGLIEHGKPTFGLIISPPLQTAYWGGVGMPSHKQVEGEEPEPIFCREAADTRTALLSHYHYEGRSDPRKDALIEKYNIRNYCTMSSALKFCYLAEGKADIIPRFGPTMEWDTAAGQAIVEAAGGSMITHEGTPFLYGKAGYRNGGFIVMGKPKQPLAGARA